MTGAPPRSPRAALAAVCAVVTCCALASCARQGELVSLQGAPRTAYRGADYPRVLARWTRHQAITILRELSTTLRVYATLRSPDFDAAYAAKWAALFRLPAAARVALERELQAQRSGRFVFVVVAAAHDVDWNDLDRPRSQWRLALLNDRGEQLAASRITLERRTSMMDQAMFPQLDTFYRLYRVEFPARLPDGRALVRSDTRRLRLSVAGPLGRAELSWRLQ